MSSAAASERRTVAVAVNSVRYEREVETRVTLADFLRHGLGLTGTHVGCEHGVCGACTVLFDGRSVRSCLMLAVQADGHEITTVEGIAPGPGTLHPLQEAFREFTRGHDSFAIVQAAALLQEDAQGKTLRASWTCGGV